MDGFSAAKLRNYYLLNPLEERRALLQAAALADRQGLAHGHRQEHRAAQGAVAAGDAELRACSRAGSPSCKGDLAPVCQGLAKLVVVDIALSRDQDNPQLIFESMNSTGRELSQADLIRNFILMGLEPQLQTRLYEAVLAADGGGLRAGGLRHPLRRLHAPLPDGEDGRDPATCARSTRRSRTTPARPSAATRASRRW